MGWDPLGDLAKKIEPMADKYIAKGEKFISGTVKRGEAYAENLVQKEEAKLEGLALKVLSQAAVGMAGSALILLAALPNDLDPATVFLAPAAYLGLHKWVGGYEYYLLAGGLVLNYTALPVTLVLRD